MTRFILLFSLATACSPSSDGDRDITETGDVETDTDTNTDTDDTQDTDIEDTDTEPPVILLEEGAWSLASATLVSDTCNVDNYQDVKEFVPPEIMISKSGENRFNIDANVVCIREDLEYTCTDQDVSESALAGTAQLEINSVMSGEIIDASTIDITFDVTIESCSGVGCIAIESVLKFPCPVTLTTRGTLR